MTNWNSVINTDQVSGDFEIKSQPNFSMLPLVNSYSNYIDIHKTKRAPTDYELINDYKRIAFSCANLNANACANVEKRLYVRTRKGEKKARCLTKSVDLGTIDSLCKEPHLQKYTKDFVNIEEVVDHPVLALLDQVNSFPGMNGTSLWTYTQLYQEILGRSYWYIVDDPVLGIPKEIWILPAQYVRPYRDLGSRNVIDYYRYFGSILPYQEYTIEEIIPFLMPSLVNPYVTGISPLRASFESNEVSNKLIAHEDSFLENEARPDVLISPGKESSIGEDEAKNLERKFSKRFGRGNIGRPFVTEEEMTITPLQYPPRDLARLEIHKEAKTEICNAYGVPLALLEAVQINRATLEAAREQHAHDAILPRINRILGVLNQEVLTRYDDTDRLFFAAPNVVPELREIKLQENVQLVNSGIKAPNEARKDYNMPPLPGGDELRTINDGSTNRQSQRDSGTSEK